MATAYYTYGIQYPIIVKHNLDYWVSSHNIKYTLRENKNK